MKTYVEKLKDPRWQKKRLRILDRDRFTCRDCEATKKTLHVHHCHYAKGDPWNTPDDFLLSLCHDCHEKRQRIENEVKELIGYLFARIDNAPCEDPWKSGLESFRDSLKRTVGQPLFPIVIEFDWLVLMRDAIEQGYGRAVSALNKIAESTKP